MSIFFRMWGVVKVPRVKGVGAMVDDGHRHIPHSPPVSSYHMLDNEILKKLILLILY